jgi:TonB family protein
MISLRMRARQFSVERRLAKAVLLLAVCAALAQPAIAQAPPTIEKHLEQELKGKVLLLRGFPSDGEITYDLSGRPLSRIHPGPWTEAKFEITNLKLASDKIELRGNRVVLFYNVDSKQFQDRRTQYGIKLQIKGDNANLTIQDADHLLSQIFIRTQQELIHEVPPIWRPYLLGQVRYEAKAKPSIQSSGWPEGFAKVYTVEDGAKPSKPVFTVDAEYSEMGRAFKVDADLVMAVIVGADGKVADIAVAQPQGLGFEEQAEKAIRKWIFKPATYNGTPVPFKAAVEISFELR